LKTKAKLSSPGGLLIKNSPGSGSFLVANLGVGASAVASTVAKAKVDKKAMARQAHSFTFANAHRTAPVDKQVFKLSTMLI
jgi:hypothetical protein